MENKNNQDLISERSKMRIANDQTRIMHLKVTMKEKTSITLNKDHQKKIIKFIIQRTQLKHHTEDSTMRICTIKSNKSKNFNLSLQLATITRAKTTTQSNNPLNIKNKFGRIKIKNQKKLIRLLRPEDLPKVNT